MSSSTVWSPGAPRYVIEPVDVLAARAGPDGLLRAPFMSFEASAAKYVASL